MSRIRLSELVDDAYNLDYQQAEKDSDATVSTLTFLSRERITAYSLILFFRNVCYSGLTLGNFIRISLKTLGRLFVYLQKMAGTSVTTWTNS